MRALLLLLVGLFVVVSATTGRAAPGERRVAFVVGNSAYRNFPALPNPRNDADDMIASLKALGFEVHGGTDLTRQALRDELRAFARVAQGADAALVFYAGHGLQYRGRNYIVPIDARLQDEFDLDYETVRVDDVVEELNRADGAKILILDACRNLPLAGKSSRDAFSSTGLAKLSGRGLVVAYATQANAVAFDGTGRNSIFTGAFLKAVQEPGLDLPQLFQRVSINVDKQTGGRQTPEVSLSYPGQFFFNRGETDREAWTKVRNSGDPEALRGFIARFPNSFLVDDASEAIQRIEDERRRSGAVVASREPIRPAPSPQPGATAVEPAAAQKAKEDADRLAWQALQDEQKRRAEARQKLDSERAAAEAQAAAQAVADLREKQRLADAEKQRLAAEGRKQEEDKRRAEAQAAAQAAADVREKQRLAEAERQRLAAEQRAAEQARVAEGARLRKLADEKARQDAADKKRLAEEERKRVAEDKRAEQLRIAEEARQKKAADDQAKAEAAARQRVADAERKRLADEQRAADLARAAEEARQRKVVDDQTKADAAERQRVADAEKKRLADEQRAADQARFVEEARQKKVADDQATADAERQRTAEANRKRLADEQRAADLTRIAEDARQKKLAEDQDRADAAERQRVADAERKRVADEQQARLADEAQRRRLAEEDARAAADAQRREMADAQAATDARVALEQQERERVAAETLRSKQAELAASQERDRLAWLELEDQQKRRAEAQGERVQSAGDVTGSQGLMAVKGAGDDPRPAELDGSPRPTRLALNDPAQPAIVARRPDSAFPQAALSEEALVRATEAELGRIGCYAQDPSGRWTGGAQSAMARFARQAKLGTIPKGPSSEILDDLKNRPAGFCPLECRRGEVAEGERCVAVARPKEEPRPSVERKVAPKPRPVAVERERPEPRPVVQAKPRAAPPQAPVSTAAAGSKPAPRPMLGVGF